MLTKHVQKCMNIYGLGCMNQARTRAWVMQPSPHIFLHICNIWIDHVNLTYFHGEHQVKIQLNAKGIPDSHQEDDESHSQAPAWHNGEEWEPKEQQNRLCCHNCFHPGFSTFGALLLKTARGVLPSYRKEWSAQLWKETSVLSKCYLSTTGCLIWSRTWVG